MKTVFPPASEGSMRAVRVSSVHVSAASRLGGGGGERILRQLVCIGDVLGELLDKSPKRNSDVPTTVLQTEP